MQMTNILARLHSKFFPLAIRLSLPSLLFYFGLGPSLHSPRASSTHNKPGATPAARVQHLAAPATLHPRSSTPVSASNQAAPARRWALRRWAGEGGLRGLSPRWGACDGRKAGGNAHRCRAAPRATDQRRLLGGSPGRLPGPEFFPPLHTQRGASRRLGGGRAGSWVTPVV